MHQCSFPAGKRRKFIPQVPGNDWMTAQKTGSDARFPNGPACCRPLECFYSRVSAYWENRKEKTMSFYLAEEAETGFSLKIISSVRTTVRPEESGEMIMTTFRPG